MNPYDNENIIGVNEIVQDKKIELNKYLEILEIETSQLNNLKNEYNKLNTALLNEQEAHKRRKDELQKIYTLKKEEEIKNFENEKNNSQKENEISNYPKNDVNRTLTLQNEIDKLNEQISQKEKYYSDIIENLENDYKESILINNKLKSKMEAFENNDDKD